MADSVGKWLLKVAEDDRAKPGESCAPGETVPDSGSEAGSFSRAN